MVQSALFLPKSPLVRNAGSLAESMANVFDTASDNYPLVWNAPVSPPMSRFVVWNGGATK